MSDTLTDSQVLGIWERSKDDIDWKKITAVDTMNQQKELQKLMENPKRKSPQLTTLAENNFSNAFVQNPIIREELLRNSIKEVKVKGKTRFQVRSRTGIKRSGQFLQGRTEDEALRDLKRKLGE